MIRTMMDSLRDTSSTTAKQSILKDYCIMGSIKTVLFYTYNPYFNYGISKKRLEGFGIPEIEDRPITEVETSLLVGLAHGDLTGGDALQAVINCMQEYGGLVGRIVSKDLRCGISATTINKVCPKLIPVFDVQLAKEVPEDKWKFPANMQIKYDGVRLIAIKEGNEVTFKTRNGKVVNLPFIAEDMSVLSDGVYDGEVVLAEGKQEGRTSVSGMINSAMHGGRINERALRYYLFDFLTLPEFVLRKCNRNELGRNTELYYKIHCSHLKTVRLAETRIVHSKEQVNEYYNKLLADGYEGVILKPHSSKYTFKRNANWIKLKATKTADMLVIDVVYGTGKYANKIGNLVVEGVIDGKRVVSAAGSGLSDRDRDRPFEYFEGKTVEIAYNDIMPSRTYANLHTLFLPRYKKIRFDKEADV